jgi:hypothetical protein
MKIAEILAAIPDILQMIALVFMAISLLATVVSRLTFWTKKDDEFVDSYVGKFLAFAPTLGKNARTKQLEEMIVELKEGKKADEVVQETSESKQAS